MSKHDNGGPAFPIPLQSGQRWQGMAPCDGMTLRDYFAAKAMQSLVAGESQGEWDDDIAARGAYRIADAMLKARDAQ